MKPTEKTKKNSSKVSSRLSLGERVPKLRFPGFEGEWEAKKFGSLICETNNRTTKENEDILLSAAIEGMFLNSELFDHQRGISNKGYKKISRNTLILSTQNLHLGNANVNLRFEHGIVSPAYKTYDIIGCNHYLLSHWIKSEKAKKFFYDATTVGASLCRRNVEWETLYEQTLALPNLDEQNQLAKFLNLLIARISAQRKLVELLKKHKRGLIKRLFRPNEHTKWKSVRLGEVGTFHKGAPLSKADISEDGKPFILYGELYTTYGEIIKDVVRRTTAEIDIPYLSRCGDVIIPTSGETAEEIATASCIMSDGVVLGGDLNIYRSEHIDGRFLAYAVRFIISRDISRIAQGVSVVHISATELKRISVSIPSKDEQIRIISVLENYDNRILHSYDILKKLEVTKDGLLQQLFV